MEENIIEQVENPEAAAELSESEYLELRDGENEGFILEDSDQNPEDDETAEPYTAEGDGRLFHLKHLGEEFDVDEKKVVELAQKGMDYDRIRSRYERAGEEAARLSAEGAFIRELAEEKGMSVEEFIDSTRAGRFMERDGISAEEAVSRARALRGEAAAAAKQNFAREKIFEAFVKAYPDVKAQELPREVMLAGVSGGDLVSAYEAHLYRQLRAEKETSGMRELNRRRSTGSRKSEGTAMKRSEFDALWYDGT